MFLFFFLVILEKLLQLLLLAFICFYCLGFNFWKNYYMYVGSFFPNFYSKSFFWTLFISYVTTFWFFYLEILKKLLYITLAGLVSFPELFFLVKCLFKYVFLKNVFVAFVIMSYNCLIISMFFLISWIFYNTRLPFLYVLWVLFFGLL